jgi:hypothetical protein
MAAAAPAAAVTPLASSTSAADSVATFKKRASALGVAADIVTAFDTAGIATLGALAFAVVPPGTAATDANVRDFIRGLLPARALTLQETVGLKRLVFESHTILVVQLKSEHDPTADPSARKLPASERSARIEAQKLRLQGMELVGALEVGHSVYDMIAGMAETNALKYIPPSKCISRGQEVTAAKAGKEIKIDSSGALHLKEGDIEKECKTADSLELHQALTRRGLAMDLVGILTFSVHQAYVSDLFNKIQMNPPPGFRAPTTTNLLRADRAAFGRMSEWAQNGIQMRPDGSRPLDVLVARARADAEIQFFMLPSPIPPAAPKKRAWDDAFNNQWQKQTGDDGKGKGKQKGKTKTKGKPFNSGKIPEQLRSTGCVASDDKNRRLCFAYNIDACADAAAGAECGRGWRLCAKKGCYKNHPAHAHPTK